VAHGTGPALTFNWVIASDAGDYFCAVSAQHQSADSDTFTLDVEGDAELPAHGLAGLGILLVACAAVGTLRALRNAA